MSGRTGRRGLEHLREELSERDLAIVAALAEHRFMTARQIEVWHFAEHATPLTGARVCRRALERLTELKIVTRLERRIGGVRAGSASFIYSLGPVGDRLVPGGARRRLREPSEFFLQHTLAIADARVDLLQAERRGLLDVVEVETEPSCWRHFTGSGGGPEILRPDLFVVTALGDLEHCWFIEIDRATASIPAVITKCRQYAAYYRSGLEQNRLGIFPLVVWATITPGRAERIKDAIVASRALPDLFRVCLTEGLTEMVVGSAA